MSPDVGPTHCQGLSRAPLSSAPSLWREPAQRGGGPRLRAWKGSWAQAGMGPGPQAHHGLHVSLLNRVPPEFCVPVVLGRLPLQSHIEAPRLCNLDILGRTWLVCRRKTQVEAHASDSTSRGRQAPGAPLPLCSKPPAHLCLCQLPGCASHDGDLGSQPLGEAPR